MLKKTKLYLLLAIIALSSAISLFPVSQMATAQTTPGDTDTTPWIDSAVVDDANVVTITHVVSYCEEGTSSKTTGDNNGKEIAPTKTDIRDGNWFANFKNDSEFTDNQFAYHSYSMPVGYGMDGAGDDGKISCKDNSINVSKSFISMAGWTDSKAAACDIGFRMEGQGGSGGLSAADCANFDSNNMGKKYLGQRRDERGDNTQPLDAHLLSILPRGANKTGGDYGYNNIQRHALYELAFTKACGATIIGKSDPSSGYEKVTIVNKEGTPVEVDYKFPDDKTKGKTVAVAYLEQVKCSELPDLMNGTADAYGGWIATNGTSGSVDGSGDGDGNAVSTCTIDGIGWIVCPVINFLGTIIDKSYKLLEGTLLRVDPLSFSGPLYDSWKGMRDIANVVFVIAFLIIVFSQLTSMGVGNYGIKKLLPKIVIAAILVNLSFFICAVAVDLSNIAGNSLRGALTSAIITDGNTLQFTIDPPDTGAANADGTPASTEPIKANGWKELAGVILGGTISAGAVYIFLPIFIPLLIGALLSVVTVVIALTFRQAMIILLIVVSPLAFVALLLPNTEEYFKRWKQLFVAMLMVYPIISLVFGASALASSILMKDHSFTMQLVGAGVSLIPLFITPIIMKVSGGLLNRWVGIVNNPNRGPYDAAKKWGDSKQKRFENLRKIDSFEGGGKRYLGGLRYKRGAKTAAIDASVESNVKHAETSFIAGEAKDDAGFRNELAGGTLISSASPNATQRALANAINVQSRLEVEEVSAANAIIQNANLDLDQLQQIAKGTNATDASGNVVLNGVPGSSLQTAAIQSMFNAGDIAKTDELVAMSGSMGTMQRQTIGDGMLKLSSKVQYYGGGASDAVKQGGVNSDADLNKLVSDTINGNKWSGEIMNSSDKDALKRVSDVAANRTSVDSSGNLIDRSTGGSYDKLRAAAYDGLTNPNLTQPSDRIRQRITAIEQKTAFNPSAPPAAPARPTPGTPPTYMPTP